MVARDTAGAGAVPPHLADLVAFFTGPGGWEALTSGVAETHESEVETLWRRIDFCAAGHLVFDFDAHPGLLGEIAALVKRHKETARRYVAVGTTFPPSIPKRDEQGRLVTDRYTGEVEQVYFRLPDEAINLYIEAVKADDPIGALLTAREHGWSAADLRRHIRTGAVPSSYRELAACRVKAQDGPPDIEAAVADFANEVLQAAYRLLEQGCRIDTLRLHASAYVTPPENGESHEPV